MTTWDELGIDISQLRSSKVYLYSGEEVLIDEEDHDVAAGMKWHALRPKNSRTIYAKSRRGGQTILLHRMIMGAQKGEEVDHRNGNGLDNRRANLRIVTRIQNSRNLPASTRNSSGHIGVGWDAQRELWRAYIRNEGRTITLGRFAAKEDAIDARITAERLLWGDGAVVDGRVGRDNLG